MSTGKFENFATSSVIYEPPNIHRGSWLGLASVGYKIMARSQVYGKTCNYLSYFMTIYNHKKGERTFGTK